MIGEVEPTTCRRHLLKFLIHRQQIRLQHLQGFRGVHLWETTTQV